MQSIEAVAGITGLKLLISYIKLSEYRILAYVDVGRVSLELSRYHFVLSNIIFNIEVHLGCIRNDLANHVS